MKKVPGPAGSAVYMVSLGCSKNLVDTEVIAGTLLTSGRTLAFDPNEADLYVINTCAFIPAARREAEEAIEEALVWKKERPGRTVVVAGCLTEWDKPAITAGAMRRSTCGPASTMSPGSPRCSTKSAFRRAAGNRSGSTTTPRRGCS